MREDFGMNTSKYAQMGVDAGKASVRRAFADRVANDFPNAFVNIVKDPLYHGFVLTQHNDGDGSKMVARLLVYAVTQDSSVIQGAVDDALAMNTGDVATAGFIDRFIITDVINLRDGPLVPKDRIME